MGSVVGQSTADTDALLLGRRTYQDFFSVWPKRTDNPFTEVLNSTQKYVASTTLEEPLPWSNSTLLKGDAAEAVAGLRKQLSKNLVVLGSGELVQSLMRRNLVDEYLLLIHPLVLGSGRRLFADDGGFAALELVDAKTTTTGVISTTVVFKKSHRGRASSVQCRHSWGSLMPGLDRAGPASLRKPRWPRWEWARSSAAMSRSTICWTTQALVGEAVQPARTSRPDAEACG